MADINELNELYTKAQSAFKTKDYDRAAELFKQILVVDENYRDASRLLAKTVKRKRQRWYNDPRLWWGVGGSALVVLIAWLVNTLNWNAHSSSPTVPSRTAPLLTATLHPAFTPTSTYTPVPLAWKRFYFGHEPQRDNISAIVIDQKDSDVLFVGMENAGIYKSIDGGLSWQPAQAGMGRARIDTLLMDNFDNETVYASTNMGGVYKTVNGGATWLAINTGLVDTGWGNTPTTLVMDPNDNQHLFFTASGQLYETTNAGNSWHSIQVSECPGRISSIAIYPPSENVLFASDSGANGNCASTVYASMDGGLTWKSTGIPELDGEFNFWHLLVDPLEKRIYAYHENQGLYRSDDLGITWDRIQDGCNSFAIQGLSNHVTYCLQQDVLLRSEDEGDTWLETTPNTTGGRIIATDPASDAIIYIGGTGLWKSGDGGYTGLEHNNGLGAGRLEMIIHPKDEDILLVGGETQVYRSLTGGAKWEPYLSTSSSLVTYTYSGVLFYVLDGELYRFNTNKGFKLPLPGNPDCLMAHPFDRDILFTLYSDTPPYLFISEDGGRSWRDVPIGQLSSARLFFDHDGGRIIYAISDSSSAFYRSDDSGVTWQKCNEAPKVWSALSASRALVDPRDPDHLFLATRGSGILVSQDGCQSWQSSNDGLESLFVNSLAYDAANPDTIYIGTDGGAYVSFNSGGHWSPINDGLLGALVVYSVANLQSYTVANTPYGIFILERR